MGLRKKQAGTMSDRFDAPLQKTPTLAEAVRRAFGKAFVFSGRAARAEFWKFVLFSLLVNLALVRDIGFGRTSMSYRLLENGKAKSMTYRVAGREKITVGGRALDTTRVVQSAGSKQTAVWIAPGVPTPVRIVQREDGSEVFRLQLTSWR